MNRNNTDFKKKLERWLTTIDVADGDFLKYYQRVAVDYMIDVNTGGRGMLLYWQMGFGKSMAAVAISVRLIERGYGVVLVCSKALQKNMINTVKKYFAIGGQGPSEAHTDIDGWIGRHFSFVTNNASNMYEQLKNVSGKPGKEWKEVATGKDSRLANLENKFIVVDEAHNIGRAIINGSTNATGFYNSVMKANNVKVLLLTGTPIVNDAYEIVPLINMIVGPIKGANGRYTTLLPGSPDKFYDMFIREVVKEDSTHMMLMNAWVLQNRLWGLVSVVEEGNAVEKEFPDDLGIDIVQVLMSPAQRSYYAQIKEKELKEKPVRMKVGDRMLTMSTYKVKSRQICNAYPTGYSPKHKTMLETILKYPQQLGLVYSQFVGDGGLNSFIRLLNGSGWSQYNVRKWSKTVYMDFITKGVVPEPPNTKGLVFAVLSGETSEADRDIIMSIFTSPDNNRGKDINLLLISATGAEGLDLKNIRHIHIMEPYWNWSRINQIKARGIRKGSHDALPKEEWTVKTYLYLSVVMGITEPAKLLVGQPARKPTATVETVTAAATTDEELYWMSLDYQGIIDQIMDAVKGVAIECSLGPKVAETLAAKCKPCVANNKLLWTDNIDIDLIKGDPCDIQLDTVEGLTKVDIDGVTYMARLIKGEFYEDVDVFRWNDGTGVWEPVDRNDPVWDKVAAKLYDKK